ncbi:MAG TPA: Gfo/Idh/MocA family oxidoreductase, partial [Bryobacteraceae bacterium]|nr:Gfo/Idh/MocA family oxidoreductase [Bryobacteraceae bacterium]
MKFASEKIEPVQHASSGRRDFLKAGGALGGVLMAQFPGIISAQTTTKAIKVGLVGCGGRGTGAASQALHADDNAELTAVADIDQSHIDRALGTLGKIHAIGSRVKVGKTNQFLGLDAYQKLIDSGVDVVLLATPPGFRPSMFGACIAAGKHVFCEKPFALTVADAKAAIAACRKAGVALGVGHNRRLWPSMVKLKEVVSSKEF